MAECKDCIHYDMCKYRPLAIGVDICDVFRNAADVVPKSEVADLQDALKCEKETNKHLSDEYIALQKALDAYEETSGLKQAKAEVAREIFERLHAHIKYDGHTLSVWKSDLICIAKEYDIDLKHYDQLKKKYTD